MKVWFSSKRRPTVRHSTYMRIVDAEERQQWKKVIESPSSIHSIISRQYITPPSAIEDEMTLLWSQDILLSYALLHAWRHGIARWWRGLLWWWNSFHFFLYLSKCIQIWVLGNLVFDNYKLLKVVQLWMYYFWLDYNRHRQSGPK